MSNLRSSYDEVADAYHATVDPDGAGLDDPTFDELVGDPRGQRVAAVACGQGRDARRLADLGAEVVGIDASESLLAHARDLDQQTPRGIEYIHGDAQDLQPLADASFDGVACYMALMDIPELEPTLRSIARILKPGGWFVAAITHPCYKSPAHGELVDHVEGTYRRLSGLPRVSYHRTLSTYVNTLVSAGLPIVRMAEPIGDTPVWKEAAGLLYVRCQAMAAADDTRRGW